MATERFGRGTIVLMQITEGMRAAFWARISPEPNTGCWLWIGSLNSDGYGNLHRGGHAVRAHRMSAAMQRGNLPSEAVVLHSCDVRCCVNPDHLEIGTHSDNVADCIRKGRRGHFVGPNLSARKTHCSRCGRPKTGENAYVYPKTGRAQCRHCRAEHAQANNISRVRPRRRSACRGAEAR